MTITMQHGEIIKPIMPGTMVTINTGTTLMTTRIWAIHIGGKLITEGSDPYTGRSAFHMNEIAKVH